MGYVMLIYMSGLSGINDEIYEAARIDGASSTQQVFRITLPLLKPTSYFLILTMFIGRIGPLTIFLLLNDERPGSQSRCPDAEITLT